jgi:acetylornithine/succinyldiaminopimelate/putrescine aminotransferase
VTARGDQLVTGLRTALAANAHVQEVRGSGLLVGIQLDVQAGPVVEVRHLSAAWNRCMRSALLQPARLLVS